MKTITQANSQTMARVVNVIYGTTMIAVALALALRGSPQVEAWMFYAGGLPAMKILIALLLACGLIMTLPRTGLFMVPALSAPLVYLLVITTLVSFANQRLPLWPLVPLAGLTLVCAAVNINAITARGNANVRTNNNSRIAQRYHIGGNRRIGDGNSSMAKK